MPSENEPQGTSKKSHEGTLGDTTKRSKMINIDEAYAVAKSRGYLFGIDEFKQLFSRKKSVHFGIENTFLRNQNGWQYKDVESDKN